MHLPVFRLTLDPIRSGRLAATTSAGYALSALSDGTQLDYAFTDHTDAAASFPNIIAAGASDMGIRDR